MQDKKVQASWGLVVAAYAGLIVAFFLVRLALVSAARDPIMWGFELPRSSSFQNLCSLLAFLAGLGGLGALGFVADRGSGRQLLVGMLALPLVLVLLEAVNMGF